MIKLQSDGIKCIVTPPNKVTQEKDCRVKTDKIDARRLSKVLEQGDYKACAVPDKERREDRTKFDFVVVVSREVVAFHGFPLEFGVIVGEGNGTKDKKEKLFVK